MATVAVSPFGVASFPSGGGHFWVYAQYALGLQQLGCEVIWLERVEGGIEEADAAAFPERLERSGLDGAVHLYDDPGEVPEVLVERAELLLNFDQRIDPGLLARFRRTALVDIDPGLMQLWMTTGQLDVAPHDVYLTTGETVGTPAARFPDAGHEWVYAPPPICLEAWPYAREPGREAFTTVSSWWGGNGRGEWVTDGDSLVFENDKRVSFLQFVELPKLTPRPLELALALGEGSDAADRETLERHGWRVRDAALAAGSPQLFAEYVRGSRGELSCAKPSCMHFQNAWVSDRTLCYLASGRPAVVQNTGPSSFLPDAEGLFRFSSLEQAADALARIDADYERHRRAARDLAEAHFDSKQILTRILDTALGDRVHPAWS